MRNSPRRGASPPITKLVVASLLAAWAIAPFLPAEGTAAIRLLGRAIEADDAPDAVARELAAAAGQHAILVFERDEREAGRRALMGLGVIFHRYLPDDAFAVTLPAGLDVASAATLVKGVVRLEPADKVHPSLLEGGIDDWALDADGGALLNVRFHPDVSDLDARAWIAAAGAEVIDVLPPHRRYTVRVEPGRLLDLAAGDGVAFVDEIAPPIELENDGSRAVVRADQAQALPYELTGNDIDVAVIDGGRVDPGHPDFAGRLIIVDNVSTSSHATHVAGTVGGSGVNSSTHGGVDGQWRGMAPGARIVSYRNSSHLSKYPGIVNVYDVEITTNSWGYGVSNSNCDIYGDYRFDAPELDEIITGLHGRRINITFSGGNERNDCDCGMSCSPPYINFANVNPPKPAKNLLVVGALNSDDRSMTTFSSWGPVDDGRIKPEVVAAGDEVGGDGGIKSCEIGGAYSVKVGTSMAAPAGTGSAALLMERYRQIVGRHPWPSTVRGLLMHTAIDRFNRGPDYRSGYGRIDIIAAVGAIDAGLIREEEVSHGQVLELPFEVEPEAAMLKVTIAWDDPAGAEGAAIALVNDLDLELLSPGSLTHLPWILDPDNPDEPAATGSDHLNNVEQVLVGNPEPGPWLARIRGFNVPMGPQPVSIFGVPDPASAAIGSPAAASPAAGRLALTVDPNPAAMRSGGASLGFQLSAPGRVRVRVLDASGRVLRVVFDGALAAGAQELSWDGRDHRGRAVAAGVYLVDVESATQRASQKLVITR